MLSIRVIFDSIWTFKHGGFVPSPATTFLDSPDEQISNPFERIRKRYAKSPTCYPDHAERSDALMRAARAVDEFPCLAMLYPARVARGFD